MTVERYAAETLSAHVKAYDKWFVESVEKGLRDAAEGRIMSAKGRRARLKN